MSVTANFGPHAHEPGGDKRTAAWIVGIGLVVSMLTSESLWALQFDGWESPSHDRAKDNLMLSISPEERQLLIQMIDNPAPDDNLTPLQATERNAAIPFTATPIAGARPFQLFARAPEVGMTALRCLTQAVYYEAAHEPLAGRRAVAQVVLNRMRHPAFPNSVCGVVYQGVNRPVCQFSFTCDGSLNRRPSPAKWAEAEMVARDALNGHVEQRVGYSTHYHANYVSPYWAPKLVKIASIGAHIFYRWPGGGGQPSSFSDRYAGVESIPAILPRSNVRKASFDPETESRAFAEARLPRNLMAEIRADNDVGGRLDVSKGWTASVPEPEETVRSASMIARQQAGEYDVKVKGGGS